MGACKSAGRVQDVAAAGGAAYRDDFTFLDAGSELSAGAKAGVVAGVVVGALAAAAAVCGACALYRRRTGRRLRKAYERGDEPTDVKSGVRLPALLCCVPLPLLSRA